MNTPHIHFRLERCGGRAQTLGARDTLGTPPNLDLYALKCTGTTGVYGWRFRWQPRGKRVAASKIRIVRATYLPREKDSRHLYLRGDTLFKPPWSELCNRIAHACANWKYESHTPSTGELVNTA